MRSRVRRTARVPISLTAVAGGRRGAYGGAVVVGELREYLDLEPQAHVAVALPAAYEVPWAWLGQLDHCLSVVECVDWVHGVTEMVIQVVHFQYIVDRRVGEHCPQNNSNLYIIIIKL